MPFRAKLKSAFRRHSSASTSPSTSTSSVSRDTLNPSDPSVYQPGEPMPRPKYRQPVEKKHKRALEAWSFNNTSLSTPHARRKSNTSLYSPYGSRLPSRNVSRAGSLKHTRPAVQHVEDVDENADEETDVANVGFSKPQSKAVSQAPSRAEPAHIDVTLANSLRRNVTAEDHTPFTADEITAALRKQRIREGNSEVHAL